MNKRIKELKRNPKAYEEIIKRTEEVLKVPQELVRISARHTYEPDKIYKLREEIATSIETTKVR